MTASRITPAELDALQLSTLPRDTPFFIVNVSQSMFSVARYSMGCTYQGQHYSYVPSTDELIRGDVVKWLAKHRKAQKTEPAPESTQDLFED